MRGADDGQGQGVDRDGGWLRRIVTLNPASIYRHPAAATPAFQPRTPAKEKLSGRLVAQGNMDLHGRNGLLLRKQEILRFD